MRGERSLRSCHIVPAPRIYLVIGIVRILVGVIVPQFRLLVSRGLHIILLGCRIVGRADAAVIEVLMPKAIARNRCRVCIHRRVSEGHHAGIGRVSLEFGWIFSVKECIAGTVSAIRALAKDPCEGYKNSHCGEGNGGEGAANCAFVSPEPFGGGIDVRFSSTGSGCRVV